MYIVERHVIIVHQNKAIQPHPVKEIQRCCASFACVNIHLFGRYGERTKTACSLESLVGITQNCSVRFAHQVKQYVIDVIDHIHVYRHHTVQYDFHLMNIPLADLGEIGLFFLPRVGG